MPRKHFDQPKQTVRLFPLGGITGVTKNMFVYEYWWAGKIQDILLVDCGIGFPDETMYGVDLVIPDVSYLRDKKQLIRGLYLTHGHEDHIGALPYLLPTLGQFPIYATSLTASLVQNKLKEFGIKADIQTIASGEVVKLSRFRLSSIHVTHSIPDTSHLVISSPIGDFYHGSDFKFDLTPLDNQPSELGKISRAGERGILCLLSDCLGSEKPGFTLSEKTIMETIEQKLRKCSGKFIFATQSSNLSRIQETIKIAVKEGRKISFVGRSLEQNVAVARSLNRLNFPADMFVRDRKLLRVRDQELFLIVAGSQGQTDSALARIARNEHKTIKIRDGDVVMISADPIPGNEHEVYQLIESLTERGATVFHSGVIDDVHVSGHGSQQDLQLLLSLTKPKYIIPIGGTYRHMVAYQKLAQSMGYPKEDVLLVKDGEVIEFSKFKRPVIVNKIDTEQIMLDGLGVGDVSEIVLRDRQTLAEEGIVVIIVPVNKITSQVVSRPDIVSRGFVYMRESGLLVEQVRKLVSKTLSKRKDKVHDWHYTRRQIENQVAIFLRQETGRQPLIVPVMMEV